MINIKEHRCETEAEARVSSEMCRYYAKTFMLYYEFRAKKSGPNTFDVSMFQDGPFVDVRRFRR